MTAVMLEKPLNPGSPEWLATVSASQIAAIIGISPWETPYSLYQRKRGVVPAQPESDAMKRGHELEPLILGHLQDRHDDWNIDPTPGTWRHRDREWQTCNPDALAHNDDGPFLIEIKTVHPDKVGDWRDGVPAYYEVQVQWMLNTLGLEYGIVAWSSGYEIFNRTPQECVIYRDDHMCRRLVAEAETFRSAVELGIEPDPDHTVAADQVAVRWASPTVVEGPAPLELPDDLAIPYLEALADEHDMTSRKAEAASRITAYLGEAKAAAWRGKTIGTRRNGKTGSPPSFSAARGLKDQATQLLKKEQS